MAPAAPPSAAEAGPPAAPPQAREPVNLEDLDDVDAMAAAVDAVLGTQADAIFEGMLDPPPWHIINERTVIEDAGGTAQVRRVEYLVVFEGEQTDGHDNEGWYPDDEMRSEA